MDRIFRPAALAARDAGMDDPTIPVVPPPPSPFPHVFAAEIDVRTSGKVYNHYEFLGIRWTTVWNMYLHEDGTMGIRMGLLVSNLSRVMKLTLQMAMQSLIVKRTKRIDDVIYLDAKRSSVYSMDLFTFAPARGSQTVTPANVTALITIVNIEYPNVYTYKDQMWPGAANWVNYGRIVAVKMKEKSIRQMSSRSDQLLNDLREKKLSFKEQMAFWNFSGAFFHRFFFGTDDYLNVLRDGFKLGFTGGWEAWDRDELDMDFMTRTSLPLYQKFDNGEKEEEVVVDEASLGRYRNVLRKFKIRLEDTHPLLTYQTQRVQDVNSPKCNSTIWMEKSSTGDYLLYVGLTFGPEKLGRWRVEVRAELVEAGFPVLGGTGTRIIYSKQRTLSFVIGILTDHQRVKLALGEMEAVISISRFTTKEHEHREPVDKTDPSKGVVMPGLVNGFIDCVGGRIGVCREFLATRSDYFRTLFYNELFVDCGKDVITTSSHVNHVWEALNILQHNSQALRLETYEFVMSTARCWICPQITHYIELAVWQNTHLTDRDKQDIAHDYDFDVMMYAIRHQEYHGNFCVNIPSGEIRTDDIKDSQLDGGPNGRRAQRADSQRRPGNGEEGQAGADGAAGGAGPSAVVLNSPRRRGAARAEPRMEVGIARRAERGQGQANLARNGRAEANRALGLRRENPPGGGYLILPEQDRHDRLGPMLAIDVAGEEGRRRDQLDLWLGPPRRHGGLRQGPAPAEDRYIFGQDGANRNSFPNWQGLRREPHDHVVHYVPVRNENVGAGPRTIRAADVHMYPGLNRHGHWLAGQYGRNDSARLRQLLENRDRRRQTGHANTLPPDPVEPEEEVNVVDNTPQRILAEPLFNARPAEQPAAEEPAEQDEDLDDQYEEYDYDESSSDSDEEQDEENEQPAQQNEQPAQQNEQPAQQNEQPAQQDGEPMQVDPEDDNSSLVRDRAEEDVAGPSDPAVKRRR